MSKSPFIAALLRCFRCLAPGPQDGWCGSRHTLSVLTASSSAKEPRCSQTCRKCVWSIDGDNQLSINPCVFWLLSTAAAERAGVLCCVLFMVISAQALAQTSATDNPSPAAAQPSVAAQETPAAAAEEKPPAADDATATVEQKPAPAEEKPVIAQDKPAAVEEKPAVTDDKPAIVEQKPAPAEAKPAIAQDKPASVEEPGPREEAGRPGREACGRRAEAGSCREKASGCAREARLEAEVCRQAIKRRCPQQRGRAQ